MQTDLPLPYSSESEDQVLGCMLYSSDTAHNYAPMLTRQDFYADANQTVYAAIMALVAESERVDMLGVCDRMRRLGTLEAAGGAAYVAALHGAYYSSAVVDRHVQIVQEMAARRRLMLASQSIHRSAADLGHDVEQVIAQAETLLRSATDAGDIEDQTTPEVGAEVIERIRWRMTHDEPSGVMSGVRDWDGIIGGFSRQGLHVIAARPSMGKTALAAQVAQFAARSGIHTVFFSLEMPAADIYLRMLAAASKTSSVVLRHAAIDEAKLAVVEAQARALNSLPLAILAPPSLTLAKLRHKCRRLNARRKLGLVVVDYLGLMDGGQRENRVQEVAAISRALKSLAREFDVPVIALSQLSRANESRADKRPMLSDLRDSGSVEQDADTVTFVHRPEYYDASDSQRVAELIVAKNRNGPTGTAKTYFDKSLTSFGDLLL